MKKIILPTALLAVLCTCALAQPPVCVGTDVEMAPFCEEACIICDVDGFRGRNGRDEMFFLPNDFCTLTQHNGKWIGFLAGSEDLTIDLRVTNCEGNSGLEIAIYEAIDCENYRLVSNCYGGTDAIRPNSTGRVRNTVPLTVGQYYYLVMDGARDDICDWQFTVVDGSTSVAALSTTKPIVGPTRTCPDRIITYTTEADIGATEFLWEVDGARIGRGDSIDITWEATGTFGLCVTASNVCDAAIPFCTTVTVADIPEQTLVESICLGETLAVSDTLLTTSGNYRIIRPLPSGCDSIFNVDLRVIPAQFESIDVAICADDSLELNGFIYSAEGTYTQSLLNRFGCDSTLEINLRLVNCNLQARRFLSDNDCFGEARGRADLRVTDGTGPFDYRVTAINGDSVSFGQLAGVEQEVVIGGLRAGTYQITIEDDFGNLRILNFIIREPPVIIVNAPDVSTSCFGERDGNINVDVSGGGPPYTIEWDFSGITGFSGTGLVPGTYAYSVTDAQGCGVAGAVEITQPAPLELDVLAVDPDCSGEFTGSILVTGSSGGIAPLSFSIGGRPGANLDSLAGGSYKVVMTDANGCTAEETVVLTPAAIPGIAFPATNTIVGFGDSTVLTVATSEATVGYLWETEIGTLSCTDCARPVLTPDRSGIVRLTATSTDGCVLADSVRIFIDNRRRVFAPNAFSPNGDGFNDLFRLFPGPEVAEISALSIFDRWGNQVYFQTVGDFGWDGGINRSGTYAWSATVTYEDGHVEQRFGMVTLIR